MKALTEAEFRLLRYAADDESPDLIVADEATHRLLSSLGKAGLMHSADCVEFVLWRATEAGRRAVRVHAVARSAGVL